MAERKLMRKVIYRKLTKRIEKRGTAPSIDGGRVKPKPSIYPETERMVQRWSEEARKGSGRNKTRGGSRR